MLGSRYVVGAGLRTVTCLGLPNIVPSQQAQLGEWWPEAVARFGAVDRKAANSLIMLVMRACSTASPPQRKLCYAYYLMTGTHG
jgi:hypothetical protein